MLKDPETFFRQPKKENFHSHLLPKSTRNFASDSWIESRTDYPSELPEEISFEWQLG